MRRFLSMIVMLLGMAVATNAMSYSQAREQALFLTDKMAYELNLTDDQYEAAYEINLDYLMSVNSYNDLYGDYWRYRNLDLSYILLDWQYRAFCDAAYFYRPLYFSNGIWHFSIYARYPHRDYFYFSRPSVYVSYRGGHSWRMNGGRSWYDGRTYGPRPGDRHFGMRDGFNRGDYGRGNRQTFGTRRNTTPIASPRDNNRPGVRPSDRFGVRESSTRTTVGAPSGRTDNGFGTRRTASGTPSTRPTTPPSTFRPSSTATPSSTPSRFGSSRSSAPFSFSSPRGGSSSGSPSFSSPRGGSSSSSPSFSSPRGGSSSGSPSFSSPRGGSSSSSSGSSRGGGFGSRR